MLGSVVHRWCTKYYAMHRTCAPFDVRKPDMCSSNFCLSWSIPCFVPSNCYITKPAMTRWEDATFTLMFGSNKVLIKFGSSIEYCGYIRENLIITMSM